MKDWMKHVTFSKVVCWALTISAFVWGWMILLQLTPEGSPQMGPLAAFVFGAVFSAAIAYDSRGKSKGSQQNGSDGSES